MAAKSLILLSASGLPGNRATQPDARKIKSLGVAGPVCPQSYPQDLWTAAKALLNHRLRRALSDESELSRATPPVWRDERAVACAGGRGRAATRRAERHAGLSVRIAAAGGQPGAGAAGPAQRARRGLAPPAGRALRSVATARGAGHRAQPGAAGPGVDAAGRVLRPLLPAQHRRGGAVGAAARAAQARRHADGAPARAPQAPGRGTGGGRRRGCRS